MKRVDERVTRCLSALRDPGFASLIEWLEQSRKEVLERIAESAPDNIGKLQGEAKVLKDILELVATSHDVARSRAGQVR